MAGKYVERNAFEEWCAERGFFTLAEVREARAGDRYMNDKLADMWIGWQARSEFRHLATVGKT